MRQNPRYLHGDLKFIFIRLNFKRKIRNAGKNVKIHENFSNSLAANQLHLMCTCNICRKIIVKKLFFAETIQGTEMCSGLSPESYKDCVFFINRHEFDVKLSILCMTFTFVSLIVMFINVHSKRRFSLKIVLND